MRLWWEIARRAFARQTAYGVAAAAGVFTNTFFGFVRAYVLLEVHRYRPDAGQFDATEAVTFVFVTQGLIAGVSAFGMTELAERVRSGQVAIDLYRPVDLQAYEYAVGAGRAAYLLLARGVVPVLAGALAFGAALAPPAQIPAAALSIVLAVAVSLGIWFVVQLTTFWVLDHLGVSMVTVMVGMLLSGLALPLNYFPHPWDGVTRLLPFAATLQLPVEIVVGAAESPAANLAVQAAWVLALVLLGRLLLRRATRKLVIQGG